MTSEDEEGLDLLVDEYAVDVVILREDGSHRVPVEGNSIVDLASPVALAPEVLPQLLDSALRLVASADVPAMVVDAVRHAPVPHVFQTSPWLHEHRALVFRDGRCDMGTFVLSYDPELGLRVHERGAL